jgi:hypothetical protein
MLDGSLLPLLPEYPLAQLVGFIDTRDAREPLGAWLAGVDNPVSICVTARGRCCRMLLSGDLGLLLARCSRVVVREGSQAHVMTSDAIMRLRTLEVGITKGSAQNPERLQELFPGAVLDSAGFKMSVQSVRPEVVLAECVTHGITVTESRIVYGYRN